MKVPFDNLFEYKKDTTRFKQDTRVGGITFGAGTPVSTYTAIDFVQCYDDSFEIKTDGKVIVITGIYCEED